MTVAIKGAIARPSGAVRFFYWADEVPVESTEYWRLRKSGTDYFPDSVTVVDGAKYADCYFSGLEAGDYDVRSYGNSGFFSTANTVEIKPFREYYWLNVRGLPEDSNAIYSPSGARVVIGQEYFLSEKSIQPSCTLNLSDFKCSASNIKINLVDDGGKIQELFTTEPQVSAKVIEYDGTRIYTTTKLPVSATDIIWTELGEALFVIAVSSAGSRWEYTVARSWYDTEFVSGEEALLRRGMFVYSKPPLEVLIVELWRWDSVNGSERVYVGNIDAVKPDALGLQWEMTIRDLLSSGSVYRLASGTYDSSFIPWILKAEATDAEIDTGGLGGGDEELIIDIRLSVEQNTTGLKQAAGRYQILSDGLDLYIESPPELTELGTYKYELKWAWRTDFQNYKIRFDTSGCGLSGDSNTVTGKTGTISLFTGNGQTVDNSYAAALLTAQSQLANRNGIDPFTNVTQSDTLGYWGGKLNPTLFVPVDIGGEVIQYREVEIEDGLAKLRYTDPFKYPTDSTKITELVPYAPEAYTVGINYVGGMVTSALSLITEGRTDSTLRPPFRGFGVPAEYVNFTTIQPLRNVPVYGAVDSDKDPQDIVAEFSKTTGCPICVRSDGVIVMTPGLRRPGDGYEREVQDIDIDNLLEPPQTREVSPPQYNKVETKIKENTYITEVRGVGVNKTLNWEAPEFAEPFVIAEVQTMLLRLLGRKRQIVTVKIGQENLEPIAVGDWVTLSGRMPGNLYGLDTIGLYCLVTATRPDIYARTIELELMLYPEVTANTYGYHIGQPIEWVDTLNNRMYLDTSYSADFGDQMPGFQTVDVKFRMFDGYNWCTDYYVMEPSDTTSTVHGIECYDPLITSYNNSDTTTLGRHSGVAYGATTITISGHYAHQFPVSSTVYSTDSSADTKATVTAVSEITGPDRTIITADWTTTPTTGDVWSDRIIITVADFDDASLGTYEKSYYFYSGVINTDDITGDWYAPGASSFEIDGVTATEIDVLGDCTLEFTGASGSNPIPCISSKFATFNVTNAVFSTGVTTLTYSGLVGTPLLAGHIIRRTLSPVVYEYPKPVAPDSSGAVDPFKYK